MQKWSLWDWVAGAKTGLGGHILAPSEPNVVYTTKTHLVWAIMMMVVASSPLIKRRSITWRRRRTIILMSWMCSNMIPIVWICDRSFAYRTIGVTTSMMSYKVWMKRNVTFITFILHVYFITFVVDNSMCISIIRMYRTIEVISSWIKWSSNYYMKWV